MARSTSRLLLSMFVVAVCVAACGSRPPAPTETKTVTGTVTPPAAAPTSSPPTAATPQTIVAPPPPVGIHQAARDGTFSFRVMVVWNDGAILPGDQIPANVPAQGIYLIPSVLVTNIGARSETFSPAYQRLMDSSGREYSPAIHAMTSTGLSHSGGLDINPDNDALCDIAFDVPEGTQPSDYVLVLHASRYSPGVTISLLD